MKLTATALQQINQRGTRLKLALALNVSERWIIASIKNNVSNGILTKASSLEVIKQETAMEQSEILLCDTVVMMQS